VAAGVADTAALASRLAAVLPRRGRLHPATQAFQALRIWVNDEMGQLDRLLAWAPERLAEGGVLGIISFHSGEDRRVKRRMRDLDGQGFRLLTRRAQLCSPREEEANPRARSARLRLLRREATMTAAPRGQVDRWGQP
jgi:16S rRNA (cytosine1402-N4)-methyltransferase